MARPCLVCGAPSAFDFVDDQVAVLHCSSCGHRSASHAAVKNERDYHDQYDQKVFVDSLERTRRRQAAAIGALIRGAGGPLEKILDFGCGRGFFLDTLKAQGVPMLAGTDNSQRAVALLQDKGVEAFRCDFDRGRVVWNPADLSFQPTVVTLLDVIEHFADPGALLDQILADLPSVKRVVIKVPVSSGGLYAVANLLRRFGVPAILHQLYQVGTFPPHQQYFSRASLERLLSQHGLKVTATWDDPDFDDLFSRIRQFNRVPGAVSKIFSALLFRLANLRPDSRVVVANRA